MYCAIGVCNECLVTVDGVHNMRACVTKARPGAVVRTMGSQE
jgi:predicted molibdopterin-dependent oxidoreductase YjgC